MLPARIAEPQEQSLLNKTNLNEQLEWKSLNDGLSFLPQRSYGLVVHYETQ